MLLWMANTARSNSGTICFRRNWRMNHLIHLSPVACSHKRPIQIKTAIKHTLFHSIQFILYSNWFDRITLWVLRIYNNIQCCQVQPNTIIHIGSIEKCLFATVWRIKTTTTTTQQHRLQPTANATHRDVCKTLRKQLKTCANLVGDYSHYVYYLCSGHKKPGMPILCLFFLGFGWLFLFEWWLYWNESASNEFDCKKNPKWI